jgi:hypothetical protein
LTISKHIPTAAVGTVGRGPRRRTGFIDAITREPGRLGRRQKNRMGGEPGLEIGTESDSFAGAVCRDANPTSRIGAIRIGDTEVTGLMTANWAAAVVNVLILAFFVVVAVGIGLGVYAAGRLKKAEAAMASPAPAETAEPAEV